VNLVIMLAVLLGGACSGCGTTKPPPPLRPDPGMATCATACARMHDLGCGGGGPRCVPACENAAASGIISYDVMCLTAAETCAAIEICDR
jgi:hypothetical protein